MSARRFRVLLQEAHREELRQEIAMAEAARVAQATKTDWQSYYERARQLLASRERRSEPAPAPPPAKPTEPQPRVSPEEAAIRAWRKEAMKQRARHGGLPEGK